VLVFVCSSSLLCLAQKDQIGLKNDDIIIGKVEVHDAIRLVPYMNLLLE
jgi:hypothetical protein